jgi:hypothetical protein
VLTVCTVLRSGGDYEPRHVEALRAQVERHLPGALFVALSDQHLKNTRRVPLKHASWTGWWAKMELFRPDLHGDILFFDLDTVITGSLVDIAAVGKLTILRDFYRDGVRKPENGLQSSVMYLPEAERAEVWEAWNKNTFRTMSQLRMRGLGDQAFLETLWLDKAARWQDVLPGQIVSYKVHCNPRWKTGTAAPIPAGANVICFHGRPRPWQTPEFAKLYAQRDSEAAA